MKSKVLNINYKYVIINYCDFALVFKQRNKFKKVKWKFGCKKRNNGYKKETNAEEFGYDTSLNEQNDSYFLEVPPLGV